MFPSQVSCSTEAQFCINWMSYKNCISNGFSRFQQNGEFVDMTLAADGHLVKVHQNIVALASPYLKALILSASCPHPVVFLNNISQEMLSFILEYIYTGEVKVPKHAAPAFIDACKALHINGVDNLYLPKRPETVPARQDMEDERLAEPPPQPAPQPSPPPAPQPPPPPPENNFAAHITISSDNFNVEVVPNPNDTTLNLGTVQPMNVSIDSDLMNYQVITDANIVENENNFEDFPPPLSDFEPSPLISSEENRSKTLINNVVNTTNQDFQSETLNLKENHSSTLSIDRTIPPRIGDRLKTHHYSISNRGSIQLLLNRFMYYCHHHSCEGRKRRWRCVDYRKLNCPALIDTDDGNIINRSEVHSHPDHDFKILKKFKSKQVFTSLTEANDRVAEKPPKGRSRKRVGQK